MNPTLVTRKMKGLRFLRQPFEKKKKNGKVDEEIVMCRVLSVSGFEEAVVRFAVDGGGSCGAESV